MSSSEIRVRFAPSPTGHLHVGSARVAIFNWLFAKHVGGKYLLRIEDTDVLRSKKEYELSIIDSLKWLDIVSDEPIVYQLSRVEEHKKIANLLMKKGLAYPCFCESISYEERIEAGNTLGKYNGCCREKKYTADDLKKPHAVRLKAPQGNGAVKFEDLIRGQISFDYDQLDDFVLIRRDGIPTYNFVVVLDDIYMKISHVIRGDDHISNTPKQVLLYEALGASIPKFAHLPMILGASGKPLSKRDAATSIIEYRNDGFLPNAMFNFLVRLGWAHGDQEVFTKEEMIKYFSLENVGKKGAVFDLKKLNWLNGFYIRQYTNQEILKQFETFSLSILEKMKNLWSEEILLNLISLYKDRTFTLLEMGNEIINLATSPSNLDLTVISKWLTEKSKDLIGNYILEMEEDKVFSHHSLLEIAQMLAVKFNVKLINIAQPLRYAVVGKLQSPGIFELIAELGKEEALSRIKFLYKSLS